MLIHSKGVVFLFLFFLSYIVFVAALGDERKFGNRMVFGQFGRFFARDAVAQPREEEIEHWNILDAGGAFFIYYNK